jgi:alpha-L-fucosidase
MAEQRARLIEIELPDGNVILAEVTGSSGGDVADRGKRFALSALSGPLAEMGKWLKVNGEAIYAAGPNPFPRAPAAAPAVDGEKSGRGRAPVVWDWRATSKLSPDGSGKIYLHIFQWPADGKFAVTSTFKAQLAKAYLVANPKTVLDGSVTTEGDQTTFSLKLPTEAPDPIASVVCLEVKP